MLLVLLLKASTAFPSLPRALLLQPTSCSFHIIDLFSHPRIHVPVSLQLNRSLLLVPSQ